MHFFRRLTGALVALMLVAAMLPSASARQFYSEILNYNDTAEISTMLDAVSQQSFSVIDAQEARSYMEYFLYQSSFAALYNGYFPYTNSQGYWAGKTVSDGTYSQVVSATGCFAYCKFVSQVMYGTQGTRRDLNERAGQITAAGLKAFLEEYAQAGEHIRVDSKHSVTFVSCTEDGFYYMDYAGDQHPCIHVAFTTYANFAARCNELYKKVWLYEADWSINEDEVEPEVIVEETLEYEPAEWLSDYAAAAEELGLTQSGSAMDYNGSLTLAETVTLVARAHSLFTVGGAEFEESGGIWYAPYAEYLEECGVLEGSLDYNAQTTREEFVALLYAAVPDDMELGRLNRSVEFADADEIENYRAVRDFYRAGILTGVSGEDGVYFYPDAEITRGEAIALIARLAVPQFRVSVDR